MPTCYQATLHPGAWKIWPNEVWYPSESEVRFDVEQGTGFHRPILRLRGLAIDLEGHVYGLRNMSRPQESGYQMEGRVSIGGKTCSAFTSSRLFERPDGSLVDVAVFIVRDAPKMETIPPYEGWSQPTGEDLETWADDAAALGDADALREQASYKGQLAGILHGDLARSALSYRAEAIDHRLAGRIEAAARYEQLSEEKISEYRKAAHE